MKQVTIIFPHTISMFDFLLEQKISNVETNSNELSIRGCFTEEQVELASLRYGAHLHPVYQ